MNPWAYRILTEVSYEYIRKVASGTMNKRLAKLPRNEEFSKKAQKLIDQEHRLLDKTKDIKRVWKIFGGIM